jgi:ACS family glucarate transporter-like MFS transporter
MKRYLVLLALFVLSLITYIDRVAISSAKGPIANDLALSDQAMGWVFSSFALGYALAQIPSGWFADKVGPRLALAVVVIAWSFFTALTGIAQGVAVLLVIRFLFGIGEAGAFPGSARAIFNWLPVAERGRANGILFSGSRLGGALAFPLLAWMLSGWGWRLSFVYLGLIGVVWAVVWLIWFSDHPAQPLNKNDSGKAASSQVGFGEVFRSGRMWLTMTQYFASNFTFFICLSWMLPYLKERYRLSDSEAAGYAMIPLLFGATSQWISGFVVDVLYRSGLRGWSRRIPAIIGFVFGVAGLVFITQVNSPTAAVACFTLATFGVDMTISPSWSYCMDIGGTKSGAVSGSMNMIGNLGSFVSANAFPWLHGLTGSANTYFVLAALLNVVAIACWWLMRPPADAVGAGAPQTS